MFILEYLTPFSFLVQGWTKINGLRTNGGGGEPAKIGHIDRSKCRFNNPPIGTLGSIEIFVAEKSRLKFKF